MDYLVQRIDVGIVVAFLFINLIVGLSHRYLEKDFREYALGGKNFSTAALVATIVATAASGSSMFVILENTYEHGLYYLIAHLGLPVGMIIMGQLTVRMGEFLNNVSVAEAMGNLYGKTVQIITAVSGILRKVGFVVIQFKVMSQLLSMLWGADNTIMLLAAAGIVIVYSTLGGVRAVTFTDVLQFFTLGAILPILALTIWNNLPEPAQVNATLAHDSMFDVQEVVGLNPPFTATLALFFFLAIPGFEPALFQRIAMARDARQARKALTYSAGILLLISLLIAWMSILLLTDKPGLAPGQIFFYLLHHAYVGLRGLLGIGVIAMAMSTADSYLNTCSVLFANDIVAPLTEQPNNLVSTARIFSLIIGLAALSLTFFGKESNFLTLTLFFGSLYIPVYVVPLLVAILGFRSTPRAVLIGMATGCITVVVWSIYFDNTSSIAPGMLANLAGFMGSHYLLREEGGWVGIKDKQPLLAAKRARQVAWQMLPKFFKNFQLYTYLKSNLPAEEKTYALLGLYGLGATYLSFFMLPETVVGTYPMLHTFLSYSVSTAAMVFLTYPAWPAVLKNKRLMAVVWPIGLGSVDIRYYLKAKNAETTCLSTTRYFR
ncbi:MAG: sodium:solute symporter family protein [Roseivirga sp.]